MVCGGIHMSDIPSFPYDILWMERSLRSVANLTRRDGEEFLAIARAHPRGDRNDRFSRSRTPTSRSRGSASGRLTGAAVLVPHPRAG